jgi:hypothetical protein
MTFGGLSLEGERDAGSCFITYFAILPGREAEAARDLLACLADGIEVCLCNDLDGGGEGLTSFCHTPTGLSSMVGGHGWQGSWRPIDEVGFAAAILDLAAHNRGGQCARGSLVRYKRK